MTQADYSAAVYFAPVGTPLPLAQEPLNTAFVHLGTATQFIMETICSTREVHSWSGSVVATLQDRFSYTVSFELPPAPITSGWVTIPCEPSSWVFDLPPGRDVIPYARVVTAAPKVKLKVYQDGSANHIYQYHRTWEQTWNDYVGATLEGQIQLAEALLAELTAGHYAGILQVAGERGPSVTVNGKTGSVALTPADMAAVFLSDDWWQR